MISFEVYFITILTGTQDNKIVRECDIIYKTLRAYGCFIPAAFRDYASVGFTPIHEDCALVTAIDFLNIFINRQFNILL